MQSFDWLRDLSDQLAQDRKKRRVNRARRTRQQLFLVPLRLEVLEQRLPLAADFGDAPAPYPTLLLESGARHEATGPRLGAGRDTEANGSHSPTANADGADEDGITFGTLQVGALNASVIVNVQGGAGKLDAWIDLNGDGSWSGPDDQVFAAANVAVGDNALSFDIPSWAKDGATFARFRLSTTGGLGPRGAAANGEVEDYAVTIASPAATNGLFTGHKLISSAPGAADGAARVFPADLDGDGDMDVLSASRYDDKIAWYENNGSGTFVPHVITTTADGAYSVSAADLDGDGDLDVLSASRYDDTIAWYENDGSQNFTGRTVSTSADGPFSVVAADVDGDGDLDVLCASFYDDTIAWYENDGSQNYAQHKIHTIADGAWSVFAADIDSDGDLDVLSATHSNHKITWYKNDGSQNFTLQPISITAQGAIAVSAADLDGDGDQDVLSASVDDDEIAWYENDGSENFTLRTISTAADGAWSVFAADLDGDGDLDVLSASAYDDRIAWYENDGGQNFTAHTISVAADFGLWVAAADVDGDGDLDVLSASKRDDKIAWYENTTFDFGDAPTPYPTTEAENGARHASTGPRLGASRDSESDGLHSAGATSDGSDENGVTVGVLRVGALDATAIVNVQGGGGKLDAWIDFNGDGAWGGPGEQVFASRNVAVGDNALKFDVPGWAKDGITFARFRVSTAGSLGPEGAAANGEVEDYAVTIAPPAATDGLFTGEKLVVSGFGPNGAAAVFAADVDSDGDMDVLSASRYDNTIAWYQNKSQNFSERTISTSASGVVSVFAADVDGDGDVDVLSASSVDDKIAWYENDGSEIFTARTISTTADGAYSVFAADVDGDGDVDVLSASFVDDKIAWYENDGNQTFTPRTIFTDAIGAVSVFAADVDGDGDMDVLSASQQDDKVAWYENNGSQSFTPRTISTAADGASSVFAADVDADGDLDVLSASCYDDKIAWYENDGNQNFTARTISTDADRVFSVFSADVDGDGDLDVLSASYLDDKIAWYENGGGQNFTAHTISTNADGALSVFSADMDRDGDLDVLSASRFDDKIAFYENTTFDFGDAPAPYPTTEAENGARHANTGPRFGSTRDAENDGTHSAAANADGSDENGISFGPLQVGMLDAAVTINTTGTGNFTKLYAWIDFNGDGSWGGPGEQIFAGQIISGTTNTLTFDVPCWARQGTTFARFRISFDKNLGPEGVANDGEVEDYAVTINPPLATGGVFSEAHTITTAADSARAVFAADLDRDGDQDVLSASNYDNKIAWYENDGEQNFTARTITLGASGPRSVFAADVDGDGDLDALSASQVDDTIAWYENDGNQSFTRRVITAAADGARSVFAADVDGDGDVDVLSASYYDDHIAWFENNGSQVFTVHTISTAADSALAVFAADVDSDGDLDVLSASRMDDTIAWYENDGGQNFTERMISTTADEARSVFAADVDRDGDVDVLSASQKDDKIAWYENDGNQVFTERVISTTADGAMSVFAADLDGDSDLDVLSASSNDDKIAWYENNGSQVFTLRMISTAADSPQAVLAADLDGDGDLDVLSASHGDDKIAWYENRNFDFGDAPRPYPTTTTENAAQHESTGPYLGATRDSEVDGTHSTIANADGADEDGVVFGTLRAGALEASVTITVSASAAKLDAWIDFNRDGSWGGPEEQIFASQSLSVGVHSLTFVVPSDAIAGLTFARFRISTAGGLGVVGVAADGEVEDYRVTIASPVPASGVFGGQKTISAAAAGAESVVAADLDGDGDLDALSASYDNDTIAWFETGRQAAEVGRHRPSPPLPMALSR